jgi:hypothetical protein
MNEKPLIFVCSPFGGMVHNMRRAAQHCKTVYEAGGIPYAPHLIFPQFMDEDKEHRTAALEMNKQMLEKCDAIYIAHDDIVTAGMDVEISYADSVDLPMIWSEEDDTAILRGS